MGVDVGGVGVGRGEGVSIRQYSGQEKKKGVRGGDKYEKIREYSGG